MPLTKLVSFKRQKRVDPHYKGFERRRYVRLPLNQPLHFKMLNPIFLKEFQMGKSKNVSQNGMLFRAVAPPPRKAYILIETDQKTLAECIQVDQNVVLINGKIVVKVIRTHLNLENGLFEVGIRFIHPAEAEDRQEIEELIK